MFFVLLLRRAPKWFTALECDECNVGRGRGIGKGERKRGRCDWGPATIGLLLDLGSYHTETAKKGMEEELSTLYLLSTANNVMCGRHRGVACPKLTCGGCNQLLMQLQPKQTLIVKLLHISMAVQVTFIAVNSRYSS